MESLNDISWGNMSYFYNIKVKEHTTQIYLSNCFVYPFSIKRYDDGRHPLKRCAPSKGIISICGVPDMMQCRIFASNARPPVISLEAVQHYKERSLERLLDKPVIVFRRHRNTDGEIEEPTIYDWYRCKIIKFNDIYRFDSASVDIQMESGRISSNICLHRICIDWDYK